MSNRAYSLLTVKSVDDEKRIIQGVATTPEPDRVGDIVEPLGVKFKNPLKLLLHHDSTKPVGNVSFKTPTKKGIEFEAKIPVIPEEGILRDRVNEAWQSVKHGLIAGVSIGFRPLEFSRMDDGGIRFIETEVLELSLVTIPANASATIHTIKSIDDASLGIERGVIELDPALNPKLARTLAATGNEHEFVIEVNPPPSFEARVAEIAKQRSFEDRLADHHLKLSTAATRAASGIASSSSHPGVTGSRPKPKKESRAMTLTEQIAAYEAKRAAKAARMEAIMSKAAEEGTTLEDAESEEYDTAKQEIDEVDKHLGRLHDFEKVNKAKAVPVDGVKSVSTGSEVRGGHPIVSVKPNVPKGTNFTRYAIALGVSKGNKMEAMEVARQRWGDQSGEVIEVLKTAIAAGTTTDSTWASPLINYTIMASEFIDLLRPATILGRIPGLRRVPFNIQMPRQTAGSSFGWVGEGVPKPLSKLAFDTMTLRWAKAAGIVVFTEELLRFSNPSAEELVRNDLIAACAQFLDQQFLDPDKAAVTNVSPAGITAGITPIQASGTTAAALRLDVMHLMAPFIAANLSLQTAVWIMSPTLALAISLMQNPLGQPEFSGFSLTSAGGTFMGIPVVMSENMATGMLVLLVANEILLADDGGVNIDVSREASLQMDNAPTNPPTASTVMISLWQQNMVGLRAERFINWQRRRDAAVGYIANAGYGGAPGGSGT